MRVDDLLVSNSIRRASTFNRDRVGKLHSLYRRPFSFPQSPHQLAKGDVHFRGHLSAGTGFCETTVDRLCSVCPPASWRLKISSQLDIGPIVIPWVVFLIS